MARHLPETLIDLAPAAFDRVRGAQATADVVSPDIGCEPIMAVVGHADCVGLVLPRDRDQHRTENFLARQPPIVRGIGKHGWDREIAFAERPFPGWQSTENQPRFLVMEESKFAVDSVMASALGNDPDAQVLKERRAECWPS